MVSYKKFQIMLVARGIKKKDMGKLLGVTNATISKLNSNHFVSMELIDKICKVLQCKPGDIMEYIDAPPIGKRRTKASPNGNVLDMVGEDDIS